MLPFHEHLACTECLNQWNDANHSCHLHRASLGNTASFTHNSVHLFEFLHKCNEHAADQQPSHFDTV